VEFGLIFLVFRRNCHYTKLVLYQIGIIPNCFIPNHVIPNHILEIYTNSRYTNSRYTKSRNTKSLSTKKRSTSRISNIYLHMFSYLPVQGCDKANSKLLDSLTNLESNLDRAFRMEVLEKLARLTSVYPFN
jgi:hypothetical protein